jgi:uncharacterized membrane protein YbhN (UPF0104 family)
MAIVAAFIAASSLLINAIPQGLGVAEAGITGAFSLIGLAPHLGLTFGLIRRARIIFWALLGIALFLPFQLFSSFVRTVPRSRSQPQKNGRGGLQSAVSQVRF